jgi:response regulator RpfG family c-di-GMP phosphodiesterase
MTSLTSVLIVDDEPAVRDLMARWVVSLGLRARTASDAEEALQMLKAERSDLAVIDVMMPGHDGLWLAGELQQHHPCTAVVLATAYTALLNDGPRRPVADFLVKPFARARFELAVDRGRQWRKETLEELAWHARLSQEMRERTDFVCNEIAAQAEAGFGEYAALTQMSEARIPESMAHGERVARFGVSVAHALGLSEAERDVIAAAARLHDIGKLAIPESLLRKPSRLSAGEEAIVRRHVDAGAEILASTASLRSLADVVLATHEWFGGGGYPRQLAGEAIPHAARVIAVADSYDAMTHCRSFRDPLDSGQAIGELLRCSRTQFDPDVVAAFLAVLGRH